MTIDTLSADYQRAVGTLVDREVHYCVSTLIHDLAKNDAGEYFDDILSICVQDDYQTAAEDEGWAESETTSYFVKVGEEALATDWQELCDEMQIEPHQREAYEHWIVSDWLANKLAEHGEMVCKDIHGLTVWGRATTGQAILLDGVICDIYNALHK